VEDCQVRLWLAQGDLNAAAHWARASGLTADDEPDFKRELEHIILARVLVALGRAQPAGSHLDDALKLLARLLRTAESAGWTGKAIESLVLQALAFEAKGEDAESLAALERALSLAEPQGYVRIFVDEGIPMAAMLDKAAARGITPDYVSQLLTGFEIETKGDGRTTDLPRSSPALSQAEGLVEHLSDRELEVLRWLSTDLSAPEIAAELVVSVNTVRTHIKHIYRKLDVHGRYQAVERARGLDLL
jgi:LuxR family maltose regulon positive regulatory protein